MPAMCHSGTGDGEPGVCHLPGVESVAQGMHCLLVCLAFLHRVDPRKATPGFQTHEVRAGELCISGCIQINYAPVVQNC